MASQETKHPASPKAGASMPSPAASSEEIVGIPETDSSEGVSRSLNVKLREARNNAGLTLDALSAATGFTKGYLSKLETGRSTPPIATLARIARVLNTEVAAFLQEASPPAVQSSPGVSLVRADARSRVVRGGTSFGYDYQTLVHNRVNRHMEPFLFTFPPLVLKEFFFEHPGEEMVFILSGSVEMQIGEDTYILTPGDCIYFNSSIPHRGRGINGEAKAIAVIYSPSAQQF